MATHVIDIINGHFRPDNTGRAFLEPYTVKATTDNFGHLVPVMNDPGASQNHGFYGAFRVPDDYVGTAKILVYWTSTATSGNILFAFDYAATATGETLDGAFDEQVDQSDVAPGTTDLMQYLEISLTSSNLAAGDIVEFYFYRDGTTGAPTDTMAAALTIHGLFFSYADA